MSNKRNPEIGATFVPGADQTLDVIRRTGDEVSEPYEDFDGIAETVAGTNLYVRNRKIPNAMKYFDFEPLLRTVDKFFESAKPAPLYIDEPRDRRDIENCKRKAIAMEKEGCRYAYITSQMSEDDVHKQLERIDAALTKKPAHTENKNKKGAA